MRANPKVRKVIMNRERKPNLRNIKYETVALTISATGLTPKVGEASDQDATLVIHVARR
jgi:hypothetical protein